MVGKTYIVTAEKSIDFIEAGRIIAEQFGVPLRVNRVLAWLMVFATTVEEKLLTLVSKMPIVTKKNIQMTIQNRIYDISKGHAEIGYKSEGPMKKGIRTVVRWYRDKGYDISEKSRNSIVLFSTKLREYASSICNSNGIR